MIFYLIQYKCDSTLLSLYRSNHSCSSGNDDFPYTNGSVSELQIGNRGKNKSRHKEKVGYPLSTFSQDPVINSRKPSIPNDIIAKTRKRLIHHDS